jgi:hypothetical protein
MFPLICFIFAGISVLTTSSRMTFAFARDGGLPASALWWKMDGRLGVPLNALYLNCAVVIVFGCIYLGSTVAFNAIIAASVTALGVSYGIPVLLNVLTLRRKLPERQFRLPTAVGWAANIIGLVSVQQDLRFCERTLTAETGLHHYHDSPFSLPAVYSGYWDNHELLHRCIRDNHSHLCHSMDRRWA